MQSSVEWRVNLEPFLHTVQRPLIVLLGQTASGKTDFSLTIADYLRISLGFQPVIVNADSRQCYRYLDIGTAKISSHDMRGVPHCMLSLLDPKQSISIAWFQREVSKILDNAHACGAVPILVGGSMLYLSAIIDGLQPRHIPDFVLRASLLKAYDADHGLSLHQELSLLDPVSARSIPRQNKAHLLRALEICRMTGLPKAHSMRRLDCPYSLFILGLHRSRDELHRRISLRVSSMFQRGWIEEVSALLHRGYGVNDPGMLSHGYRDIASWITCTTSATLAEVQTSITRQTCRYAKRQMTWWKGDARIQWISCAS